jgi:hypothetical protein
MALEKSEFIKRKQVILTGLTLRMFEYDAKDRESAESALLRDIVKEHYKMKPPLGFFKTKG